MTAGADIADRLADAEARAARLQRLREIDGALGVLLCRQVVARYVTECSERSLEETRARAAGVRGADPRAYEIRLQVLKAVARDLERVSIDKPCGPA